VILVGRQKLQESSALNPRSGLEAGLSNRNDEEIIDESATPKLLVSIAGYGVAGKFRGWGG
jgi:hypothetical protein